MRTEEAIDAEAIRSLLVGILEGYELFSSTVKVQTLRYYISNEYYPFAENPTDLTEAFPLGEFWRGEQTYTLHLSTATWKFYEQPCRNNPRHGQRHSLHRTLDSMSSGMLEWVYGQLQSILVKRNLG